MRSNSEDGVGPIWLQLTGGSQLLLCLAWVPPVSLHPCLALALLGLTWSSPTSETGVSSLKHAH